MTATVATFQLPTAAWSLRFAPEVLKVLSRHAQRGLFSRETVGQLFSRDLTQPCLMVTKATRLKSTWSSWSRVRFDVEQAMLEREQLFTDGWHCVGFWHTHPEADPQPSQEDRAMSREHARAARAHANGLVFVIVGNKPLPGGLRVWFDHGLGLVQMGLRGSCT